MKNFGLDPRSKIAGDLAGQAGQVVYQATKRVCSNPWVCGAAAVAASALAIPLALFATKLIYKDGDPK